tara:strand:+ start:1901 stop:2851 length:951 start_codon:yes stop_codon:yes gene_type:complete
VKICTIIPCYKSPKKAPIIAKHCLDFSDLVICVDDCCPFETGKKIEQIVDSQKLIVLRHKKNQGVGGAMKTGIKFALKKDIDILVKIDSDGQMSPHLIPKLVKPIIEGKAEVNKGNRFRNPSVLAEMPLVRLLGNIGLGFLTKISTGYWELFDPTNGFIAIKKNILLNLPIDKLDNRYFFETDFLFRCSLNEIVINEMPMRTIYGDEVSNLYPFKELPRFLLKHLKILFKRIFYHYFILDFNPGSISLTCSFLFALIAIIVAVSNLITSHLNNQATPLGIQTLFLVLSIISTQFFINFIFYDASQKPLFRKLRSIN